MAGNILDSLNKKMRCGVFTNAIGQTLVVHDQEIISTIEWAEYDKSEGKLFLIHEDGLLQDLGVEIDQKMSNNLLNGAEITLAKVVNGTFCSVQTVILIVRDYCS